jgi:hypothetical protein
MASTAGAALLVSALLFVSRKRVFIFGKKKD